MKKIIAVLVAAGCMLTAFHLPAADDAAAAALAAESESYCASTINKDRPTPPETVIGKVNEACALLEKEGPAAFPKFSGKGSPFIYEGTYVTVHSLTNCVGLVQPIKYKMVGQNLLAFKDGKGKRFYFTEDNLVREKGGGWVEYYWPKPGTQEVTRKITFVKKCTMAGGVEAVVCSGFYNFSEADVAKLDVH